VTRLHDGDHSVPRPEPAGRTLGMSALVMIGFLAVLWIIEAVDWVLPADLDQYGVIARDPRSLWGIVLAPLLHAGFGHLLANTVPLAVLGFLTAIRGLARFWLASAFIVLASGVGVWVFGPAQAVTVGASGLIFGYFGYVIGRGLFDRRMVDVLLGAGVAIVYGSILWGVLPAQPGISWQGHLSGLIGGVLAAWLLRRSWRHRTRLP
jgi:membrane associated rhomboid family serine protease